jgi:hypothetical protein
MPTLPKPRLAHLGHLRSIAEEVKSAGFSHVLLLGMGGSSLCPEVMKMTFGKLDGYPEMHVLDSTDPAQIKVFENKVDLASTLFHVPPDQADSNYRMAYEAMLTHVPVPVENVRRIKAENPNASQAAEEYEQTLCKSS